MSQTTTLILMPQETWGGNVYPAVQSYDIVGDKKPAASYYINGKNLQTVNINLAGVTGNIFIQASLATDPSEVDWFNVYELQANANASPNTSAYTNEAVNIDGSYVWMRAEVKDFQAGVVQFIKLSY